MPVYSDAVMDIIERLFDDNVRKHQSGCALWTGRVENDYPMFSYGETSTGAARWAYHLKVAPLKAGQQILRTCERPLCVNPDHYRLRENNPRLTSFTTCTVEDCKVVVPRAGRCQAHRTMTEAVVKGDKPKPKPPVRTPELTSAALSWQLTRHADERRKEFGLPVNEVLLVCAEPEQSYVSGPGYPSGSYIYQRGEWACAVIPRSRRVLTVLRRQSERWEHEASS